MLPLNVPLPDAPRPAAWREGLVVAAVVGVAYLALRTAPALAAGAFSDDGIYLSLGRALADGLGYRSVYAVGDPVHIKYPPGLPAVYAVLWMLRRDLAFVHAAALLLSLAVTSATAGLLWWIGRARLGLGVPVAATLVAGPFLLEGSVQYFNLPLSEPWFMLGWASCLVLYPTVVRGAWGWALVLGALAAVTTLIRSQAVVLIPALALAVWVDRRAWRRPALVGAAGVAPLLAWGLWHRARAAAGPLGTQPDEAAYAAWAPDSLSAAIRLARELPISQITSYWQVLPSHLASWDWVGAVIWLALLVGFAIGAVRIFRQAPALVFTTLALGCVVAVWPFGQDRFVLALLPFVGLVAAVGVEAVAAARHPDDGRAGAPPVLAVLLTVLVATIGWRQVQIRGLATEEPTESTIYSHPAQFLPYNTEFVIAASRWVGTRASPDDRLLTPLPSALWLYTGRKGVNATPAEPNVGPSVFEQPGRYLSTRVLEDDVTLLLLWNPNFLITRDAATVQDACPEALRFLELTAEPVRVAVFRIDRNDPCFVREFLQPAEALLDD